MDVSIDKVPIGAMKILSCYREVQQILAGNMPVPRTMEFFLSNVCNHACAGCHSRYMHKDEDQFLDFDILKEVVTDFAELGVEGVELSGGGEPLMYPQIIPAIAYMRAHGLKVGMFTNGTLLTEELSEFLVENVLFLRIAFDAGKAATYKKIHGRDDFGRLTANLEALVRLKAKNGSGKSKDADGSPSARGSKEARFGTATIGAKYLVSTKNWMELSRAAELAKEIGLDYLQFKALRASKFTPEGETLKQAEEEAEKARQLSGKNFQVFGSLEKTKVIGRCFLNPIHPVIDAKGDMYLCAFFHHRKDTHKIGNIYKKSFPEIWYSERHFKAFRSTKPKECAVFDCPFHEAAALARSWIVENNKHLEFI
ncbi:MAG: radical SAM protein [Thermoleophilia bacterium]|jgi:radical SAM protein with 4Fe4S-binding SPASM domain